MTENDALTPKQQRAVAAIIVARTLAEAAQQARVSEATLSRWLKQPVFRRALAEAEGQAIDGAVRRLVGLGDTAIAVTLTVLEDETVAPSVRLRAAQSILDNLIRLRELRNLEERLSALEEAAYDGQQGH